MIKNIKVGVAFALVCLGLACRGGGSAGNDITVADAQAQICEQLSVGDSEAKVKSVLDAAGVGYTYDRFSNRLVGTIERSRRRRGLMRGVIYVEIQLDEQRAYVKCDVREALTYI